MKDVKDTIYQLGIVELVDHAPALARGRVLELPSDDRTMVKVLEPTLDAARVDCLRAAHQSAGT